MVLAHDQQIIPTVSSLNKAVCIVLNQNALNREQPKIMGRKLLQLLFMPHKYLRNRNIVPQYTSAICSTRLGLNNTNTCRF